MNIGDKLANFTTQTHDYKTVTQDNFQKGKFVFIFTQKIIHLGAHKNHVIFVIIWHL